MPTRFRYGPRGLTPPSVRVGAEDLFDELVEKLLQNGDLNWAMEQVARGGMDLKREGKQLRGLNSMLDELRRKREDLLQEHSLESAARDLRNRLDGIVDREKSTVSEHYGRERAKLRNERKEGPRGGPRGEGTPPPGAEGEEAGLDAEEAERRTTLERTPRRVSDGVEHLRPYPFLDGGAREEFRDLASRLDEIRSFEEFRRKYGPRFRGKAPLEFEEALELMATMRRIDQAEETLQRGDPKSIDPGALEPLLGAEARQSADVLQQMSAILESAGLVAQSGDRLFLTPEGIRRIGMKALQDIYGSMRMSIAGEHPSRHRGAGVLELDHAKPYEYGDPFHLDLNRTLRNSLVRRAGRGVSPKELKRPPLSLEVGDFEVLEEENTTRAATALLLDMSWSMSLGNKFLAAKRVALALQELIRSKFPRDRLHLIGFFTVAVELEARNLPTLELNLGDPFTNIQDALKLAERLLRRERIPNAQIIVVTDGQPTAYYLENRLHVEWPVFGISPVAFKETLREVDRCTRRGIRINTFMLDEDPSLVHFVEEMTRINRGRAFYTTPENLGRYLLVDYLERKRKRVA